MLVIIALFAIVVASQTGPTWPDVFQVDFNEENIYLGWKFPTKGQMFYDYPNRQYRIDRENGLADRYCGTTKWFRRLACTQIVKEEKRYIIYPEIDSCCYCCDSSHGCGVLKPDWAADAVFVEETIDHLGNKVQKFDKKGAQSNYIYQLEGTQITTQIDQIPNSFLYFKKKTWTTEVDQSVFDLPPSCSNAKKCGIFSVCTAVRRA